MQIIRYISGHNVTALVTSVDIAISTRPPGQVTGAAF